jgi:hypothetical protein
MGLRNKRGLGLGAQSHLASAYFNGDANRLLASPVVDIVVTTETEGAASSRIFREFVFMIETHCAELATSAT